MEHEGPMVPRLRELRNEWRVSGYSRKRRGELLEMLQASEPQPAPPPQLTWKPMRPQPSRPAPVELSSPPPTSKPMRPQP